jgi:tagatose 1,6-diphosphate aldolase
MKKLTIGKIRGIQKLADSSGIFTMCAMDHRGSMKEMINKANPNAVTYEQMVAFKFGLCEALAPHSSAVLLDPVYGAAQCIAANLIPRGTGLLVSMEESGYEGGAQQRLTAVLPGWDVEKIKRMGADAVKLLVYYRPEVHEIADRQLNLINRVAADCVKYDIPLVVESVGYPIQSEVLVSEIYSQNKPGFVIQTAKDITGCPIDIFKAEFPADMKFETDKGRIAECCRKLNDAAQVPWVILSQGVDFDIFEQQVEYACKAGASGFLAGRAIWKEVFQVKDAGEQTRFLKSTAVERLKKITEIASRFAQPWYKKLGLPASVLTETSEKWYLNY